MTRYNLVSKTPKLLGRQHRENELKLREKRQIEIDRAELQTRRRNMDDMGSIIDSTNEIMNHVVAKLDMCEKEKTKILNEINENNKEIYEINKVCDDEKLKLKQKIYFLKDKLKKLQKNGEGNNTSIDQSSMIDSLNEEIKKLAMKNNTLQQKLRDKPVYVEELRNKVIKEASDCRKEKEKNKELQDHLKEIYEEKNILNREVKESRAHNRTLEKNIQKCEEKFETVNQYVDETVEAMQVLKTSLKKCTNENKNTKEAMVELQNIVRSLHESMEETR